MLTTALLTGTNSAQGSQATYSVSCENISGGASDNIWFTTNGLGSPVSLSSTTGSAKTVIQTSSSPLSGGLIVDLIYDGKNVWKYPNASNESLPGRVVVGQMSANMNGIVQYYCS